MAERGNFRHLLQDVIKKIQSTHLLLERSRHIDDATNKLWVVWELYQTMKAKAKLEIWTSDATRRDFIYGLVTSSEKRHNQIFDSIAKIDVLQSKENEEVSSGSLRKMGWTWSIHSSEMVFVLGMKMYYEKPKVMVFSHVMKKLGRTV